MNFAFYKRTDANQGTAHCLLATVNVFPHRGLARVVLLFVLSAVLGEACPLYVHSVSDPLPYCLNVTTASPVEREEREVKGQSFHLSFSDIQEGLTCVWIKSGFAWFIEGHLRKMTVVRKVKSLKREHLDNTGCFLKTIINRHSVVVV